MSKPPKKKTILITAGPTIEPLDPVRYISNYSTGIMGFELAKTAKDRGHNVILISGPVSLAPPKGVKFIPVESALDMKRETFKFFKTSDCVFMAAAVSDFRPASFHKSKMKKGSKKTCSLRLKRNPDILSELAKARGEQILVGYSLETESPVKNAKKKLKLKDLDVVIMNKIGKKSSPFGSGIKDIAIIDKVGNIKNLRGASKSKIARVLLNKIEEYK
jgi:phosphopantothenoylcysteine decarboxylase/phosphopantothenate--cysteine ligase